VGLSKGHESATEEAHCNVYFPESGLLDGLIVSKGQRPQNINFAPESREPPLCSRTQADLRRASPLKLHCALLPNKSAAWLRSHAG
jgi:hypothetical protein